jgi:hypothetical protein
MWFAPVMTRAAPINGGCTDDKRIEEPRRKHASSRAADQCEHSAKEAIKPAIESESGGHGKAKQDTAGNTRQHAPAGLECI